MEWKFGLQLIFEPCVVLVEGSTMLSQLDVPPWYNAIIASCSTHNAGLVADSVRGVRGLFETVARANWCVIVALFPSLVLGDRYVAISCRCSRMHDEPFRRNWHLLLRLKDDVGQPMLFHPSKLFNWTIYEVNFEYHSQSIIYIFYIYFYTCRNLFVRLDVKKMEIRLDNSYCIWDRRLGYVDLNFKFYLWCNIFMNEISFISQKYIHNSWKNT